MLRSNINNFMFHLPVKIVFGANTINSLETEIPTITQGKSILFLVDNNLRRMDFFPKVQLMLEEKDYEITIYDQIFKEPTLEDAKEISILVKDTKFDVIIGLGGGSVLDLAKTASVVATNGGNPENILGFNKIKNPGLPKILIPTTAGTGSEVSKVVVLSKELKELAISPHLYANISIIDPTLTLSLPKNVTVNSGLDVLSHSVEAFMSTDSNPIYDLFALEATRLVKENLKNVVENPDDISARTHMSYAAMLGGIVLSAKLVYGHSVAYTLATRHKLPHGLSCIIPLPYIMALNASYCTDKLVLISEIFGITEKMGNIEKAKKGISTILNFIKSFNLPTTLKELDIDKNELKILAIECVEKYYHPNNPRQLTKDLALKLYEAIYSGDYSILI